MFNAVLNAAVSVKNLLLELDSGESQVIVKTGIL